MSSSAQGQQEPAITAVYGDIDYDTIPGEWDAQPDKGAVTWTDDGLAIPFGQMPDGRMVAPYEVPAGLACGAHCAQCRRRLIARKGDHNRAHFAHEAREAVPGGDGQSGEAAAVCAGAGEASEHLMAKQIFAAAHMVKLPPLIAEYPPMEPRLLLNAQWSERVTSVRLEQTVEGLRPDIIVECEEGGPLPRFAIEVWFTHKTGPEKIDRLKAMAIPTYEIDLRRYRGRANDDDYRSAVENKAPRAWLYHPAIDRAQTAMAAQYAAEEEEVRKRERIAAIEQRERDRVMAIQSRSQYLVDLSRLDSRAMKFYDIHDPEEYAVVAQALRQPLPRLRRTA